MNYDKNDNIRRLFVANQSRLNNEWLMPSIVNICENILKIYEGALQKSNQAKQERGIFKKILEANHEKFYLFLDIISQPQPKIKPENNNRLVNALKYVYGAIHGTLSVEELLGTAIETKGINEPDRQKIHIVLKEIFVNHLKVLISEAEKKLSPEENEKKVPRKRKHVEHLSREVGHVQSHLG